MKAIQQLDMAGFLIKAALSLPTPETLKAEQEYVNSSPVAGARAGLLTGAAGGALAGLFAKNNLLSRATNAFTGPKKQHLTRDIQKLLFRSSDGLRRTGAVGGALGGSLLGLLGGSLKDMYDKAQTSNQTPQV